MARLTNAELLRRIDDLEAENIALRSRDRAASSTPDSDGVDGIPTKELPDLLDGAATPVRRKHRRNWSWTLLATVLIVIGAILAPVAVVASWAKVELTDTDRFVAAYAPLATDPVFRAYLTDETVAIVNQQVDIDQLTSEVIDGITQLGTGPVATRALEALKGPAAEGIRTLIRSGVSNVITSDAFANVWAQALRVSHTQLVAALQNDPNAAIDLGANGSIGIQLAPIIEAVKQNLVAQGITFADRIPTVDRTITIAQSDAIPTVQLAYGLAIAAGAWLPWVGLLFLAAGVLVARRRAVALVWSAVALALSTALTLAAFGIGAIVFSASISPSVLPSNVASLLFDTVAGAMRDTAVSVLVLAIVVAVVAWYSGPFEVPRRLRGFFSAGVGWIRSSAKAHGVSTGRTGEWLWRQRAAIRVVVAIGAAAIVLFVRPLTVGGIVWTLVVAVVVIALLELLQRPPVDADGEDLADEDPADAEGPAGGAADVVEPSEVEAPSVPLPAARD
ncbi:hypothetical protein ACL9RL_10665 [Plantibacter sp. Mn2098]|uniref:hypothetical protein n=1 Tax=Plantibacter sp. Mn2098 TaxID=3395266 RepID=UPI003BE984FD